MFGNLGPLKLESKVNFICWNTQTAARVAWSGSAQMERLSFFFDRNVCVPQSPWGLLDELSLGLFAPHKHSISPFLCSPTLTFPARSSTSCPQPLSARRLLGELLKGQTVPQYSAQMAPWSPQSPAQFLSPPVTCTKNRGINAEKNQQSEGEILLSNFSFTQEIFSSLNNCLGWVLRTFQFLWSLLLL